MLRPGLFQGQVAEPDGAFAGATTAFATADQTECISIERVGQGAFATPVDLDALTRDVTKLLDDSAEAATTAGSRLARNEEHRRLCAALRTLPVESQTLLELHYWEGLDAAALAEVFDAQVATIRQRLSRARLALKDALAASAGAPLAALATVEDMDTWAKSMAG